MDPLEITDALGNRFIVQQQYGAFEVKKIIAENTLIDPTKEELDYVIKALQKKANSNDLHSIKDILMSIKDRIDNKLINSEEELIAYIASLQLSDSDKTALYEDCSAYMKSITPEISTDLIKFKDTLIAEIRKSRPEDIYLVASFDVTESLTTASTCQAKIETSGPDGTNKIEEQTFYYDEDFKKQLIEPVLAEIVMKTSMEAQKVTNSESSFGYRSDYHMSSIDKTIVHAKNLESDYANYLEKFVNGINSEEKITNDEARDQKLSEMTPVLDKPMDRKLEKKGSIENIIIYAIICLTIGLLVLLQIIFL